LQPQPLTRGLHSSTFRLNISAFCGKRWSVHGVTKKGQVELRSGRVYAPAADAASASARVMARTLTACFAAVLAAMKRLKLNSKAKFESS